MEKGILVFFHSIPLPINQLYSSKCQQCLLFLAWPIRGSLRGSFGLRNCEMLPLRVSYFPKYNLPCFKKQKSKSFTISFYQKSPVIFPVSSTSILSAAGTFGSPGMVMISPVRATMKPAPAEILRLRTVTSKSVGAPSFV